VSKLLTIPEVAAKLSVGESTVRSLIAGGKLVFCRIGPTSRNIRISEDDLEAYVQASRVRMGSAVRLAPAVKLRHL
jgi:excisionase family DNA binding protein